MNDLIALMDRTWPPHAEHVTGPWLVREGRNGGNRVSSVSLRGDEETAIAQIGLAEAAQARLVQPSLFRLLPGEERLDAALDAQGCRIVEPVFMRVVPADALAGEAPEHLTTFPLWPPLAVTATVWTEGGVGPERLAIMDIAPGPKTVVLGRTDDRAAGAVFVAINGDTAMVHALHVAKAMRRRGLARNLMRGVGRWALENGARNVALAVTRANVAANELYEALGMNVVGSYHYRIK